MIVHTRPLFTNPVINSLILAVMHILKLVRSNDLFTICSICFIALTDM